MNFLTLENITKSFGEKVLFENLKFTIEQGQKIAIVARNGAGKTTLLRIAAGIDSAEGETAKIQFKKDIRIGILMQDPQFDDNNTIMEEVFASDNEMIQTIKDYELALLKPEDGEALQDALNKMEEMKAWDFESRLKEILSRFKITNLDQKVGSLSGGQQKRLALAQLLIQEPEFLILDEPTNHLDMDMIEWLEEYLQSAKLTLLMVTHDRYFLERVCNQIVELENQQLYKYKGNYSDFLEKRAMRDEVDGRTMDNKKKLLSRELQWIRKQPKARGTKAKSRVDSFHNLKEETSKKVDNRKLELEIKGQRLGSKILEAEYLCKNFDDLTIVKDFNYKFRKGERVGVVGPNGIGKSTFINLLTKQIRPSSGKVVVGSTIVFGYYTQDGIEIKKDKRVIDVVRDIAEYIPLAKGMKLSASQLLEKFLFEPKQQQVYVSKLSGGEKRRLYLLTVLMENPNFLILDEPTNDLDILTLNILEDFLMEFPGCLLIISHDRYFMDKIVDHLFVFEGDGVIKDYNGNYSEYRIRYKKQKIEDRRKAKEETTKEKKATTPEVAPTDKPKAKLSYHEKRELEELEKDIKKLEKRKVEITEKFNDTSLTGDDISKLSVELGEVTNSIDEKEMRWLELEEMKG